MSDVRLEWISRHEAAKHELVFPDDCWATEDADCGYCLTLCSHPFVVVLESAGSDAFLTCKNIRNGDDICLISYKGSAAIIDIEAKTHKRLPVYPCLGARINNNLLLAWDHRTVACAVSVDELHSYSIEVGEIESVDCSERVVSVNIRYPWNQEGTILLTPPTLTRA
jgi:hypothetical protein